MTQLLRQLFALIWLLMAYLMYETNKRIPTEPKE
jgi:hypothetical protein